MEETLGSFVRKNRGLDEEAVFRAFLSLDQVHEWVGTDEVRRGRLRMEFRKAWEKEHAGASSSPVSHAPPAVHQGSAVSPQPQPHLGPAGPRAAVAQTVVVRPQVAEDAAREVESHGPALITRPQDRHGFACPMCKGMRVGSAVVGDAVKVRCPDCHQEFPDMLALIPLERVGALEIAFGPGWRQWAGPAAILAGLAGVYLLLKLLR